MADGAKGCLILILEDEPIVGLLVEDTVIDAGGEAVLASNVDAALAAIAERKFDGAVLDINVNGELSYPVATRLGELGVPFIFASGYGDRVLPAEFATALTLTKPFAVPELQQALEAMLAPGNEGAQSAD